MALAPTTSRTSILEEIRKNERTLAVRSFLRKPSYFS